MKTRRLVSIERNVLAGFVAATLVLALVGAVVSRVVASALETSARIARASEVLTTLESFKGAVFEAESAQRAYYLSANDASLTARDASLDDASRQLRKLRDLTETSNVQLGAMRDLEADLRWRVAAFSERTEAFRAHGLEAIRRDWSTTVGPKLTERIDAAVTALTVDERRGLAAQRAQLASETRFAQGTAAAALLLLLAFQGWLFWRVRGETTARYASEDDLQRSEARLRGILEVLPVGVSLVDAQGRVLELNRVARELWGGTDGDEPVPPRGWWPDDGLRVADDEWPVARALKGETAAAHELAIQARDGTRRMVLNAAAPLRAGDGRLSGAVAVFQDLTKFRSAEEVVRESARFDATHREALTLFNVAGERSTLLGELLGMLAAAHPFPVSAFYAHSAHGRYELVASHGTTKSIRRRFVEGEGMIGQAAAGRGPIVLAFSEEVEGLAIDAGVASFTPPEVLVHPVVHREHRHGVLVLAASRATTAGEKAFVERLAAQLGVALHNLKQFDDVRALAAELKLSVDDIARKNALLEDSSRMKSEFLANMSHELRTPLNAIIGFSEVLRDGLLGPLAAKQREYVNDIFESGQHLLALINDILDLSKIEAGRLELELAPVTLEPLLRNCLAVVRERASSRRVELELAADPAIGTLRGDPRKTRQIVYNLVSNAVKFSAEGGRVVLRASLVDRARAASAAPGEGPGFRLPLPDGDAERFVEISVSDAGIGLAPAEMSRLFQPFVQIESSLSRQYEGTGLGLAMVRRLTELHGGTVAVTSAPGQGSCFTVWLPHRAVAPAAPATAPELAIVTPAFPVATQGISALLIEDDGNATELMRALLVREGYRVAAARTAEEGLELAKALPAVIVLDILLPGMDGWECLARLKQTPALAHIPVVIVSMVADREKGRALGAAAVLQKPLRREELLAAVTRHAITGARGAARILVVDDDPAAVELAGLVLGDAGWEVLRAYGGSEGVAQALAAQPDLIVLDLLMPDVDGFDVVAKLRTDARTAQIPILVLTSKVLDANERERLDRRVQSIVGKGGFGRDAFLNEVRRALATRVETRADLESVA